MGAVTGKEGEMAGIGHGSDGERVMQAMLDWAFTQSSVIIGLYDTQVRLLRINGEMCRALGLDAEADGVGLRITELFPGLGFATFEGTALQVMKTGKPAVWEGFGKGPGETLARAWRVAVSAVRDADDTVCGALSVGIDVTEHRLARKRLALVNDASNLIGNTLDVTRTAEELAEIAVPQLADMVMIDIQDCVLRGDEPPSGPVPGMVPLRRLACGSVLPDAPEVAVRPGQVASYPARSPAGEVLSSGRPVILGPAGRDVARWASRDSVGAEQVVRYGIHSVMVLSLIHI